MILPLVISHMAGKCTICHVRWFSLATSDDTGAEFFRFNNRNWDWQPIQWKWEIPDMMEIHRRTGIFFLGGYQWFQQKKSWGFYLKILGAIFLKIHRKKALFFPLIWWPLVKFWLGYFYPFFRCPVVEICYEKRGCRSPIFRAEPWLAVPAIPSARILDLQETACAEPFGRPVELWCISTMEMGYDKKTSLSGIETMGNMFFSQPVWLFFICHRFSKKAICGSSDYGSSTTGTMGHLCCGFTR